MLFTSLEFLLFFPVVFLLYWLVGKRSSTTQNVILLAASTFFYGFADPRMLLLLFLAAGINYWIGIRIAESSNDSKRTIWMRSGIFLNLATLGFFKYFDFFYAGFSGVSGLLGFDASDTTLHIMLPLGISFITFQNMGYLLDVHNEEIEPYREPLPFFTYVFFFPKILAGPIERAQRFIPQIETLRTFDLPLAVDGCRQILWGLFAKVVIADNCSTYVDQIFNADQGQSGSTLLLGAFLYFFQIYCDFSGYSNMAIGISKLLGIRLMTNFAYPFFATNISEFWKRWHISLTTWMMDYVFTPINFVLRSYGKAGLVIGITVTFLAVGLWHGANWNFFLFGVLQSIYFLPLALKGGISKPTSGATDTGRSALWTAWRMVGMFTLMMFTFILLRAIDVEQTVRILKGIFSPSLFSGPAIVPLPLLSMIVVLLLVEWMQRDKQHALQLNGIRIPKLVKLGVYYTIVALVLLNSGPQQEFIYFQF